MAAQRERAPRGAPLAGASARRSRFLLCGQAATRVSVEGGVVGDATRFGEAGRLVHALQVPEFACAVVPTVRRTRSSSSRCARGPLAASTAACSAAAQVRIASACTVA